MGGTSMAAPHVGGGAMPLEEYERELLDRRGCP
jgi:hypothetical protein